ERTTDRVLARRTRRQVLHIVDEALQSLPKNQDGQPQDPKEHYWLRATRVEALFGLQDENFAAARDSLFQMAPEPWMNATTENQLNKLGVLLGVALAV